MYKTSAASLQKLPTELVLQIATYLAPCEAVLVGLTCHRLYGVVSATKTWAGLRAAKRQGNCAEPDIHAAPDEDERWLLLELILRDLPSHELCHFCRVLHRLPN